MLSSGITLANMTSEQPALLLIHGFPMDGRAWKEQVEALQAQTTVLAPDLRGFGSDTRPVPEAMTMEAYAQHLKELLDERGIRSVVLCGLSMGGYVAMAFLAAWPERVRGLVLANTRATADDADGRRGREETALNAFDKGMAVMARAQLPKLLTPHTCATRPEAAAAIEKIIAGQRPEAVAAASRGMALRPDRMDLLRTTEVPTLIITGSQDVLMPLPSSQAMADIIPGKHLVVIPDAGHLSNVDQPEAFNAALSDFLESIR